MALDRKIAYIDLSTGKVTIKPIHLEMRKKYIGGGWTPIFMAKIRN